jgi:GGDEF domain-containing protein
MPKTPDENPNPRKFESDEEQAAYDAAWQQGNREGRLFGLATRNDILKDHDTLTGLKHKQAWQRDLERSILEVKNDPTRSVGIILVDLTRFKEAVNDHLGHEKGDDVLVNIARVLEHSLRPNDDVTLAEHLASNDTSNDAVSRLGGDEFGVRVDLTPRPDNVEGRPNDTNLTTEQRLQKVQDRIRGVFTEYIGQNPELSDNGFDIAIGGAVWDPNTHMTSGELLHAADQDMYREKEQQRADFGPARNGNA